MNPNNLIRPAILQNDQQRPAPNPGPIQLSAEVEAAISQAVSRICIQECRALVPTLVNPARNVFTDQGIDAAHR